MREEKLKKLIGVISRLLHKRAFVYGAVLVVCLANGIVQTAVTYDADLGMGDNSTFYAFTRNIVDGEVMYKDFIHFRTPGTMTLFAGLMEVFGKEQSTTEISTRIETLVLFPSLFLIAAMVLFRKRNPWYVVAAYAGIAFMPGVAQLRAAFGLLTIAIYIMSFEVSEHQKRYLFASGFLVAVTFFFGQEIFLMVALCMTAGELYRWAGNKWRKDKLLPILKYLGGGLATGLVPLLVYMAIFSSLANFLYYTLYYSFVQQPRFMDLPFPELTYGNLMYYIPFVLYWLCFMALYTNKKLGLAEGLLLSFGILRLITATGRSDFGHLLFSIPELFLIVPFLMLQARFSQVDKATVSRFTPYGVVLATLLWLGMRQSLALAAVPFVILLALYLRPHIVLKGAKLKKSLAPTGSLASYNLYALMAALFVVFAYILAPTYLSVAKGVKHDLVTDDSKAYRIGGVKTDEINYKEIQAVRAAAAPFKPTTVFAFPIQPFYYSLAEHHAARFLTFEPQTTIHEQDETISDLQRTKPEVIVFDPLQAHGLSGSLWKISDYITSNYRIVREVNMRENLWVMVPKDSPARDEKLVFRLFHDNTSADIKARAIPIQSSTQGLYNAIAQQIGKIEFVVDAQQPSEVLLSLRDGTGIAPATPVCGLITIGYPNTQRAVTHVCSDQGTMAIPIEKSAQPVTIVLEDGSSTPIIWNDVTVKARQ